MPCVSTPVSFCDLKARGLECPPTAWSGQMDVPPSKAGGQSQHMEAGPQSIHVCGSELPQLVLIVL